MSKKSRSAFSVKGFVEVVLSDKDGNVKHKEIHENHISPVGHRLFLARMFSSGTYATLLMGAIGTRVGQTVRAIGEPAYGIYCMDDELDLTKLDSYNQKYAGRNSTTLPMNVTFYNNNGSAAAEEVNTLTPVNADSWYNIDGEHKIKVGFVKNSGAGTFRSIIIGGAHTTASSANKSIFLKELNSNIPPAYLAANVAQHLIEHTSDGTIIHGGISAAGDCNAVNLKTGALKEVAINANRFANITGQFGGLCAKGAVYKVAYQSASSNLYTARISYVKNWKTGAATVVTYDVNFSMRDNVVASANYHPVLVYNTDTENLEVFVTVSVGNFGAEGVGANVMKAVVTLANDGTPTLTSSVIDLGIMPYSISNNNVVTVNRYLTGTLADGKYYLPYRSIFETVDGVTTETIVQDANGQLGVVMNAEDLSIDSECCFVSKGIYDGPLTYVVGEGGIVRALSIAEGIPCYVECGRVLSAVNLDEPVTKAANDVMRVRYIYDLSVDEQPTE
jgi:hypothetical protein